jgi:hypothetical protein
MKINNKLLIASIILAISSSSLMFTITEASTTKMILANACNPCGGKDYTKTCIRPQWTGECCIKSDQSCPPGFY